MLPRLGHSAGLGDGLRTWLEKGSYRPRDTSSRDHIVLENVSADDIMRYLSFDYERFALSSWESFHVSKLEYHSYRLLGWPLLKLYYSGFFAAHAIMRSVGEGVVQLDKRQTDVLNNALSISTGIDPGLTGGTFLFSVTQEENFGLIVTLEPPANGNGVHDAFWKGFCSFLDRRSTAAVQSGAAGADLFVAGVSEIHPLLKPAPSAKNSWFSTIRNEINYQHRHGVWHPLIRAHQHDDVMTTLVMKPSSAVRLDFSPTKHPVSAFISIAHYLAALNYDIAEFSAARSSVARSFGVNWRRLKTMTLAPGGR